MTQTLREALNPSISEKRMTEMLEGIFKAYDRSRKQLSREGITKVTDGTFFICNIVGTMFAHFAASIADTDARKEATDFVLRFLDEIRNINHDRVAQ